MKLLNIVVCVATTNDAATDVAADPATEAAAASGPVSSGTTHTHVHIGTDRHIPPSPMYFLISQACKRGHVCVLTLDKFCS